MKAFIFAAGNGGRMDCPMKPMLEVGGVPILKRTVMQLLDNGIDDIFIGVSDCRLEMEIERKIGSFVNIIPVSDPEAPMLCTLMAARHVLEKEPVFVSLCGDEVYPDEAIAIASNATIDTVAVGPMLEDHGTTGIVATTGSCFKYINGWVHDRDQLLVVMMSRGVPVDFVSMDRPIVNVNTWDGYRLARWMYG